MSSNGIIKRTHTKCDEKRNELPSPQLTWKSYRVIFQRFRHTFFHVDRHRVLPSVQPRSCVIIKKRGIQTDYVASHIWKLCQLMCHCRGPNWLIFQFFSPWAPKTGTSSLWGQTALKSLVSKKFIFYTKLCKFLKNIGRCRSDTNLVFGP